MEAQKSKWTRGKLINKKFGKLTVIEFSHSSKYGRVWKCQCDCGQVRFVDTGKLNNGNTKSCGCIKQPSLIGKKFGKLTVIKDEGIRKSNVIWLCQCECGETKIVSTTHLNNKNVRSCGCLRSGNLKGGIKNLGKGIAVMNRIVNTYKSNADLKNIEFSLTIDECKKLFSDNCFYCDSPPLRTRLNRRTKDSFTYNGIDRMNNFIGYTVENSVSCCTDCNLKKGTSSKDDFLSWVKKIALNHFHFCNN